MATPITPQVINDWLESYLHRQLAMAQRFADRGDDNAAACISVIAEQSRETQLFATLLEHVFEFGAADALAARVRAVCDQMLDLAEQTRRRQLAALLAPRPPQPAPVQTPAPPAG